MGVFSSLFGFGGCKKDQPDSHGAANGELEMRKEYIKTQEAKVSEEALSRKERSHSVLREQNIPYNEYLPVIETIDESKRRTTEDVARRAMALCIVAVKGEGVEQETIDQLVNKYQISSAFTPQEKAFIENPQPTQTRSHSVFCGGTRLIGFCCGLWGMSMNSISPGMCVM